MSVNLEENEARKMKNTGRKRTKVDYEAFVRAWVKVSNASGSRLDLCRELDITYETAASRKEKLEKMGIPLPPLQNSISISKIQRTNLAQLVKTLSKRQDQESPQGFAMKKPPVV